VRDFSISLSVIIPTYNRAPILAATLDAIAKSNIDMNRLEVIVVDDGSSDDTWAIQSNKYPFLLRYLHQPNQGDALARNNGAQLSCGNLLVFLDDDITVTPDLLARLEMAHRDRKGVIVLGMLITANLRGLSDFEKPMDVRHSDLLIEVPFTELQSGLFAISRQDFCNIRMGQPLAPNYLSVWCDVEFAYRADLAGFSFIRCLNAIGFHHDNTQRNLETKASRLRRVAKAGVLLFQRHPQLQEHLPMFLDKTEIIWRKDPPKLIARKIARTLASTMLALRVFEGLYVVLSVFGRPSLLVNSLERWILGGHIYRGYRQGLIEFGPIKPDY